MDFEGGLSILVFRMRFTLQFIPNPKDLSCILGTPFLFFFALSLLLQTYIRPLSRIRAWNELVHHNNQCLCILGTNDVNSVLGCQNASGCLLPSNQKCFWPHSGKLSFSSGSKTMISSCFWRFSSADYVIQKCSQIPCSHE